VQSGNQIAYNSFDEGQSNELVGSSHLAAAANAHHSLSMFDSEISSNKVNNLMPLHHQLSQNAILAPHPQSLNYSLGRAKADDL